MAKLYGSVEVAEKTGRTKIAIQKIAQRYPQIGTKVANTWLFTEKDIAFIQNLDPNGGRPTKKKKPVRPRAVPKAVEEMPS